ncbi:MAG: GGDEF domain-containing protein [Burkholderiales bacterium]|nr:GGDEF domain-containing protein [Burkholderiales bacterium]
MKPSLARLFLVGFFVLALAASAGGFLLHAVVSLHQHYLKREPPPYAQAVLAAQLQNLPIRLREEARAIARSPLTLEVLAEGDHTARQNLVATLRGLYPDLQEIQILSEDEAAGRQPVAGSLSPAQRELIELLRQKPDSPDAMRVDRLNLRFSAPVRHPDNDHLLGYVLLARDLGDIQLLFSGTPLLDGYAELQQEEGGHFVTVLKRGDEGLKAITPPRYTEISGTPWRLATWSAPPPGGLLSDLKTSFVLVWAGLVLLLALTLALIYFYGNRALQDDLAALTKLFSDLGKNRLRKAYNVQLEELQLAFHVMYQLAKLTVGKHLAVVNSAGMDHLSQVHNRRSFDAKQHEIFQQVKEGWPASLLILDIDEFKRINDIYGHDAGDQLIVQFGKALKERLRSSDFVARLGGDEFCVIFPNTPLKRAMELAERLRRSMPATLELAPGVVHALSWSGGLSEYNRNDQSENAALARADQALLEAKRGGRNRTEAKAA